MSREARASEPISNDRNLEQAISDIEQIALNGVNPGSGFIFCADEVRAVLLRFSAATRPSTAGEPGEGREQAPIQQRHRDEIDRLLTFIHQTNGKIIFNLRDGTQTDPEERIAQWLANYERNACFKQAVASDALAHPQGQSTGDKALDLLKRAAEFIGERAPDPKWWREYFLLTGAHMFLTDEGWQLGETKAQYLADFDDDEDRDAAILDEVNAPTLAAQSKDLEGSK